MAEKNQPQAVEPGAGATAHQNESVNTAAAEGAEAAGEAELAGEEAASGSTAPAPAEDRFPVVGIGASAGGLEALEQFFKAMPPASGMAFVIIVHLSPDYKSHLSMLLQKYTEMPVFEIEDGQRVLPNTVYVIAPDSNVGILNNTLHLLAPEQPRSRRAPVDYFFRSLAQDQRQRAIGIILSGMGSNGSVGLKSIKEMEGMVMVQEPATARYDGMPKSAIAAEAVDYVLPPSEMPARLIEYIKDFKVKTEPLSLTQEEVSILEKIFIILRNQTGHDFSNYKETTIRRRIVRRMTIHKIERMADYVRFLAQVPSEVELLFKEFLISVTNFFRDPEVFEVVQERVLPQVFQNKPPNQPVRMWVPGCATGEEAYSIAIILREYMQAHNLDLSVQIFATDLDADAIEIARWGSYPDGIVVDVSPERLRRFFAKEDQHYRISRDIREMVIFAVQSVVKDPPFSQLDMISCRNLLIYLNENLQQRVLDLFHYSLKPKGFLLLGTSESRGKAEDLFAPFDKKWKIFQRVEDGGARQRHVEFPSLAPQPPAGQEMRPLTLPRSTKVATPRYITEHLLLEQHTPAGVLVNEEGNVVYFHGQTDHFLRPPQGESPFDLLQMARSGLGVELRAALHKAARERETVVFERLQVKYNGSEITVKVTVQPVPDMSPGDSGWLLVLFEEQDPALVPAAQSGVTSALAAPDQEKFELERELQTTRDRLQATIEELQASNEDVRSANEELQAANEELQSINEELETSQEELQSANEELVTMNADFQIQINELAQRNNDMHNLLVSTQVAAILIDLNLCIKFYTPRVTDIINLISSDVGRPLADLDSKLVHGTLLEDAEAVLDTLEIKEKEVQSRDGSWYNLRILPYRTTNNAVEGVVLTFIDITNLKQSQAIQQRLEFMDNIVATLRKPLLVLEANLRVVTANRAFYELFQLSSNQTKGQFIYQMNDGVWNNPRLRELLEQIISWDNVVEDFEIEHTSPELGWRVMNLNARRLLQSDGEPELILLTIEDVTERRQMERQTTWERRYRVDYLESIVATIRQPLLVLDTNQHVVSANRAFYQTFQTTPEETVSCFVYNLGGGQWNNPRLRELLEQILPQNNTVEDFELTYDFPQIGRRTMRLNARRLLQEAGKPEMILLAMEDVTER